MAPSGDELANFSQTPSLIAKAETPNYLSLWNRGVFLIFILLLEASNNRQNWIIHLDRLLLYNYVYYYTGVSPKTKRRLSPLALTIETKYFDIGFANLSCACAENILTYTGCPIFSGSY